MSGTGREGRLTRAGLLRRAVGASVLLAAGGGFAAELLAEAPSGPAAVTGPFHRFVTRPDLQPALLAASRGSGVLADGLLFATPALSRGQQGPLIVDDDAQPIWYSPTTPLSAANFRVAVYRGEPVLTWWEGTDPDGLGRGTHVVADAHYRVIARVPAGEGMPTDLHEFLVSPSGTALVTSWESVERDLRGYGGPARGQVIGGVVQELELPSGRVLFEWHSLDHVALGESHARVGNPFDYFHINSIAPTDDGQLLVSARNTWAVYKIDRGSGEVVWRLGGKRSDFAMDRGTHFAWQHDARPHPGGLLSLFDDGAAPRVEPQSRGLLLALDERSMRASLGRAFTHTPPLLAHALGSVQLLAGGNVLVGFGTAPYLTEYAADGRVLLDARLPPKGENYRALRFPWTGRPLDQPMLVASSITGRNLLYASWNGATAVATWLLRGGPDPDRLADAARSPRTGFETVFDPPPEPYAAAVALDAAGNALATSTTIRV